MRHWALFFVFAHTALSCVSHDISEDEPSHNHYVEEHQQFFLEINKATERHRNTSCSGCSCYTTVIKKDLLPFHNGITKSLFKAASAKGVVYQIFNQTVFRQKDCLFPARCEGVDYFLNSIRTSLPNVEFVVNFHDWPQISRHFNSPLPVFSFSKTNDYHDIMYPAWSFHKGGPAIKLYPTGLGQWNNHRKNLQEAAHNWPWVNKLPIAFFRGSRTSPERDPLILLSNSRPDLADAKYTKNQAWKSEKDTLGFPPADEVSLEDHCRYRYLVNFRGVAASFRLKFLFLCNSTVLHVGNEWKEFFYEALKPWIHYVPIDSKATEDDYRNIIQFIQQEEEIAIKIAREGFEFIRNNLKMEHVKCYWKRLLKRYSSLLKYVPELDVNLVNMTK